jgi:hypothetical protein
LPSPRIANLSLDFFKGGIFVRYTVTTFKVRLEVAESGIRMRNSETAAIVARGIFNLLDAD